MMEKLLALAVLIVAALCSAVSPAEESKPFYMGVYVYDYQMAAAAESVRKDYFAFLEEHLKILEDHGVNVIHLTVSKPAQFGEHLRLAEDYGIKLLPQLDFVYFNAAESDEAQEARAQQAGAFLREHAKDPRVLAWSVKEEVFHADVNRLAKYYFQILQHAPDTKFFTLHNALGAAKDQPVPDPIISGTDRYAFWWEFSGGGYLASPAFALDWTRREATVYYEESARRGADFMLVTTASGMLMPQWANTLAHKPHEVAYPTTPDEQLAMQKKALAFAEEGRMGWRKFATPDGDFYNVWKYYRAPKNCVKAMAWTGVLEGAKLFLLWHYEPVGNPDRMLSPEQAARSGLWEIQYVTLAGRPGMDNPQLAEFAEASREIRAYEQIITRMAKATDCPVHTDDKNIHANAFTYPGLTGRIIVMQNANVGIWPAESRTMFKDDDPIQIDNDGNLVGYVALTEPTEVRFSLTEMETGQGVYDLKTGEEISGEGGYKVTIAPGSGVLLYFGSKEDAKKLSVLVR